MENYKNLIQNLCKNRKLFSNEINDLFRYEEPRRFLITTQIDEVTIDHILNELSDVCDNYYQLTQFLDNILPNSHIDICKVIVESTLFPRIVHTLETSSYPLLLNAICEMVYFSPTLIMKIYQYNFFQLLYSFLLTPSIYISHYAIKFIRKIIPYGMENKILLFATGMMHNILELVNIFRENNFPPEKFIYVIKTVYIFVGYDPVFGQNSFRKTYGMLHSRKTVMRNFRSLGFPVKVMFKVSQFIKNGNGFVPNRELYYFIDFLLSSQWAIFGLKILEILVSYCQYNSEKIIDSTSFFHFVKINLFNDDYEIKAKIFRIFQHILYFTDDLYENKFKKLKLFSYGFHLLNLYCQTPNAEDNNGLILSILSCMTNGVSIFNQVKTIFLEQNKMTLLLHMLEKCENKISIEVCWLIVTLLNSYNKEELEFIISEEIITTLIDFLNNYEENLLIAILHLFIALIHDFPHQILHLLQDEYAYSVIEDICQYENEEISKLGEIIKDIITPNILG